MISKTQFWLSEKLATLLFLIWGAACAWDFMIQDFFSQGIPLIEFSDEVFHSIALFIGTWLGRINAKVVRALIKGA